MMLRFAMAIGPGRGTMSRPRPAPEVRILLSANNVDIPATPSGTTLTVTAVGYAGTYSVSQGALAAGPVCLVPAVISPAEAGQPLTVKPGLWACDAALGAIRIDRKWLADGAALDNQVGLDLAFHADLAGRQMVHAETASQPGLETAMQTDAVSWPAPAPEPEPEPEPVDPQPVLQWTVLSDQRVVLNDITPNSGMIRFEIDQPNEYQGSYVVNPAELAQGPICLVPPVIAGEPVDGVTLTATPGLWISLSETVTRSGEWLRDGVVIADANQDTRAVSAAQDGGSCLSYRETVTDDAGSRQSVSSELAVAGTAIDSVVVIGASLMEAMFGKSLTAPHAGATALLAEAGQNVPVYGWATGGSRISAAASHYTAARAAFPKALIVMHFGGNDVTVGRPHPGEATAIANGLAAVRAAAGNDPRFYPASLTFRNYDNLTFQDPSLGSKPYNEALILPWIAAHYPHAMAPYGRPKLDFYSKTLEQHDSWLHADTIHLTAAGYTAFRTWIMARIAEILRGTVPDQVAERVYVPPTTTAPAVTRQPSISGDAAAGATLTLDPGTASGVPAPTRTIQWRLNGVVQAGQTGLTYTRPATVGAIPSALVTWSNGTAPDATATASAAATTLAAEPAPVDVVYPNMTRAAGTAAFVPGKFGLAMDCAGSFFARASTPLTPAGTVWGVEAWVKLPTVTRSNIAWGEAGNDRPYLLVRSSGNSPAGQACITYQVTTNQVHLTGGPRVDDDQWHHVAGQFRADGADLFVDGIRVASSSTPVRAAQSALPWTVGMFASTGSFQWMGQIAEVLIWNGMKYTADFAPRTAAHTSLPAGTTAYWALNGNLLGGLQS